MKWLTVALLLLGCRPATSPVFALDAGDQTTAPQLDGGTVVTPARLGAWLDWQAAVAQLPPAGAEYRDRARREAALLRDAGLTFEQADAIEAVVAAVVAERSLAKLTATDELQQFRAGLQQLSQEQRLKAEAVMAEVRVKSLNDSRARAEMEFGGEAVGVVLSREADVTRAWEALLNGLSEKR